MKAGLVGPSYQQLSLPFNAERTVNLYPVLDPQGKDVSSLYGTPGLSLFAIAGGGPGRGAFTAANGRCFVVSGPSLYEITAEGTVTSLGNLDVLTGSVTMDENGFQLAICDSENLYIFTYSTNNFTKVTSAGLLGAATVTFIDGYFVVNRPNSGIFQISALYDGLTWAALDFATAESSPDNLLRVLNVLGQLWLFGAKTTEIWSNTGSAAFPFAKVAGAKMETGISAPYSALAIDNAVVWIGRDNNGRGIVYRAQGFTPQRVSTEPIELRIQAAPQPDSLRAYAYQENGHTFIGFTGGGMETSIFLDLSTQLFHERAFLNQYGSYEQHLGAVGFYAFNKQYVIARNSGKIYEMNQSFYSDNGDELCRDRIFTHLFDEGRRFRYRDLTVGFETGVGLVSGQGSDPQAILYLSRDGGKTFSGGVSKTIGRIGEYMHRVIFHRLGQARQMTFRLRITDPVKVAITGAYFNTGGTSG